jgi:predicted DCC family thiol-disulfide oxidoreductase YuxK
MPPSISIGPRVASPPIKPLLIFDGDCGFCRRSVSRWQRATGEALDYLPFQDGAVERNYPEIPRRKFAETLHLILPDGSLCTGAEAVFRSLAAGGVKRWLLWCYTRLPFFAGLSELGYREVAAHREFLSTLDRRFFGPR